MGFIIITKYQEWLFFCTLKALEGLCNIPKKQNFNKMRMKTDKVGLRGKRKQMLWPPEGIIIIALLEHKIIFKISGNTAADANNHEKQIYSSFSKDSRFLLCVKQWSFHRGAIYWAQSTIALFRIFPDSFKKSEENCRLFLVPSIIKVRQQQ